MAESFHTEWEKPELDSLANLAENLVYRLPGCDETLIRKTLQEVAREFVADTKCFTSRQSVEPDGDGYCTVSPTFSGGIVDEVREVWKDDRLLRRGVDWVWHGGSGLRIAAHMRSSVRSGGTVLEQTRDSVRFTPGVNRMDASAEEPRDKSSGLTAVVVENLGLFTDKVPRWFLRKHGDGICSGVLGRLFAMTGKAWSDAQQAADERVRYENAKSEERMRHEIAPDGRPIDMSEVL